MTSKFDPDGLPIWEKRGDLYVHDDPVQQAFAWGCLLEGFGLPEFDIWLSALPPCPGKSILLKRRAEAFEAGRANKHDLEVRHLEFMHERMLRMMDVDFLVPLAKVGKPVVEGRSKGGKKSAKHRQAENLSRDKELAKIAKSLIDRGDATPRTVKKLMIDLGLSGGLGIDRLRDVLAKSGIK